MRQVIGGEVPAQHPAHRTLSPTGRWGALRGCPQPGLAQLSFSDCSGGSLGTCWDLQVCRQPWRVACFLVSTQAGVPAASTPIPAPTRGRGEVEMPRPDVCKSTSCSWLAACVSCFPDALKASSEEALENAGRAGTSSKAVCAQEEGAHARICLHQPPRGASQELGEHAADGGQLPARVGQAPLCPSTSAFAPSNHQQALELHSSNLGSPHRTSPLLAM